MKDGEVGGLLYLGKISFLRNSGCLINASKVNDGSSDI
jgi:hypothetical protein